MDQDATQKPSMVVYACNLALGRMEQEDQKFKASLDYLVRPCLKEQTQKAAKVSKGWSIQHRCLLTFDICWNKCKGEEVPQSWAGKDRSKARHHPNKAEGEPNRERGQEGSSCRGPAGCNTEEPPTLAPKMGLWYEMVKVGKDTVLICGPPAPIENKKTATQGQTKQDKSKFWRLHSNS